MEYTKENLIEKFNAVPKNIQGLIVDESFGPAITFLCKGLGVDAVKALDVEDEVLHVLVGISHPKDFIRNIQAKIGVDEEKARAIAEKVNDEIFQLVKESLKVVHNIGDDQQPTTNNLQQAPLRSELGSTPTPPVAPKPPAPQVASEASIASLASPNTDSPRFPQMIVPRPLGNLQPTTNNPQQAPEAPRSSQNIFEQKLQGVFKMPKEETLVPPKPTNNSQPTTDNQRGGGVDPYREAAQ